MMRTIEAVADAIDIYLGFVLLDDRLHLYRIAWPATFVCVLMAWALSMHGAIKNHPRHYAAAALLACAWLLVLVTYVVPGDVTTPRERQAVSLASDIAAILLVYIGGLMAAGAKEAHKGQPVGLDVAQRVTQWLLPLVALSQIINFASQFGAPISGVTQSTSRQTAEVIGLVLVISGFYSIWRGTSHICEKGSLLLPVIAIILILYTIPQTLQVIRNFPEASKHSEASLPKYPKNLQIFVLWNAIAKLLLTSTLSIAIYRDAKAYTDATAAPASVVNSPTV
jgi:hypothetical protein